MTAATAPRSFAWSTLEHVLEVLPVGRKLQQGWSPQCEGRPASGREWGVLKTTAIQAGAFLPEHNKALPAHMAPRPALEVRRGDLLLTNAGPRARCAVPCLVGATPPRLMLSGKVYRFRTDPNIMDSRFLELYLRSPTAQATLDRLKTGISDSGLNLTRERFLSMKVPVPELAEQRRIVEALEDHLSRLDAAARFLRPALARVRPLELLETELLVRRHSSGAVRIGELLDRIEAGRSFGGSGPPAGPGEWGIIKVSAMTWGAFRPHENKAVPADAVDRRFEIRDGDLLVSRANTTSYVGAAVLVDDPPAGLLLSDKSLRLVPKHGVQAAWLAAVLAMPTTRQQISGLATGTKDSMRNISQANLLSIKVPAATSGQQSQLVLERHRVQERSARITVQVQEAERRSANLRRALLSAAFSGHLTRTSINRIEEVASA